MKCRLLLLMIFVNLSFNLFSLNSSFSRDKVLFVGGNNPPYEYKNEDGEPEGYDIDLVKEIMKRIGSDYEIKLFNWDKALKYAKEDKNAVLLGMIYSKENAAEFSFTTPFEYISLSIISNKNNKYQISYFNFLKVISSPYFYQTQFLIITLYHRYYLIEH